MLGLMVEVRSCVAVLGAPGPDPARVAGLPPLRRSAWLACLLRLAGCYFGGRPPFLGMFLFNTNTLFSFIIYP